MAGETLTLQLLILSVDGCATWRGKRKGDTAVIAERPLPLVSQPWAGIFEALTLIAAVCGKTRLLENGFTAQASVLIWIKAVALKQVNFRSFSWCKYATSNRYPDRRQLSEIDIHSATL